MPLPTLPAEHIINNELTIVYADWIATVDSDETSAANTLIQDGAIAFQNGYILDVGTKTSVSEKYNNVRSVTIKLPSHHLIIPGLINCHTHFAMSLLRGYADDFDLQTWLTKFVWPTEKTMMSEEFVYNGALLACYEAIRSGTTMINDSYFFPDSCIKALEQAGIRGIHSTALLDFGDGQLEKQCEDTIVYLKNKHEEISKQSSNHNLTRLSFNPHACYTVPENILLRGHSFIREFNKQNPKNPMIYHIHLHESKKEIEDYNGTHNGTSAIKILNKMNIIDQHFVAAHCVRLTDEEIQIMAEKKGNVVHCPKSNLKLSSGFCPVWKFMKAGINVCLGTDGGCSNNSVDMLSEMQFAALIAKPVAEDPCALDAYSTLRMATRNGARALGRLHDLGSLESGKLADMVAIDLAGDNNIGLPIFDPISHLIYTTHPKVTNVWVNGKHIMKNSNILTMNISDVSQHSIVEKLKNVRKSLYANYNSTN